MAILMTITSCNPLKDVFTILDFGMAVDGNNEDFAINLDEVLTIANKPFNVKLTKKYLSWSYKKKQPFSEKERKSWTCSKLWQNIIAHYITIWNLVPMVYWYLVGYC